MSSIKLPVHTRLLAVRFWGVRSCTWIFGYVGALVPLHPKFQGHLCTRAHTHTHRIKAETRSILYFSYWDVAVFAAMFLVSKMVSRAEQAPNKQA